MMRIQNWDVRLNQWASGRLGNRFEWGKTDCVVLAREALGVMYPDGLQIEWPIWSSKDEAYRILKEHGGIQAEMKRLGMTDQSIKMCQTGDILIFNSGTDIEGCGVCLGRMYISVRLNEAVSTQFVDYDDPTVICMRMPNA